jgi:hypothetical protein
MGWNLSVVTIGEAGSVARVEARNWGLAVVSAFCM